MTQQWDFPVDGPVSLPNWRERRMLEGLAIAAARVAGDETLRRVALDYGVNHEMLRRALKREGFETSKQAERAAERRTTRSRAWPNRQRPALISKAEAFHFLQRHEAAESVRAIARAAGVSYETMRRGLARVTSDHETVSA